MDKKTNRTLQAEKTKKHIYKIGIDLLKEKGFDNVNIKDIVKTANVSIGTFYHYYDSKLDLIMDLYRNADAKFETKVRAKVKGLGTKEAILLFFNEYAGLAVNDGIEVVKKIYIPENHLFINEPRPMHKLLLEIVEDESACEELFLLGRGVVFDWALHDGTYDIKEKMDKIISTFLTKY